MCLRLLSSTTRVFARRLDTCLVAISYKGLQSALATSLPSPLRCICIAANAMMALLTIGDSAAKVAKKARVDAHFGPISTGVRIGGMSI